MERWKREASILKRESQSRELAVKQEQLEKIKAQEARKALEDMVAALRTTLGNMLGCKNVTNTDTHQNKTPNTNTQRQPYSGV